MSNLLDPTQTDAALKSGGSQQIRPLPKGVSVYQLDNGMKVLLIENPALPMVGVNVVVKVGSAYETFSTSGMSHMLEHLLFNGTTTRTQKQLYDDVDKIGGYNNATTAEFYTNYMMVTPAENIRRGMEIQADMLFRSTLPLDKFEKEKGIVLEEISKSLADPQEQLERNTLAMVYQGHALSLPTLGTYSTIQSLSRDDVNAFYKNNYVPNNMILSIIGRFRTNMMLSLIKEIYGKASPGQVRRASDPEWATGFQRPQGPNPGEIAVEHRRYDGEDHVVRSLYSLPPRISHEYAQLLSFVTEKNKDRLQASLNTKTGQNLKSLKLATRFSHLGNYLEATLIMKARVDEDSLLHALTTELAGLSFALPAETVSAELTKTRTEFARNIEKPHMFGIYNADALAKEGIEAVLAAYGQDNLTAAARELAGLKLGHHPFVLVQRPAAKKDTLQMDAAGAARIFSDKSSGKNLIAAQNEANRLLAIHYLVKHKAAYEFKYGKDASKVLHECLNDRLKSDANQKASGRFGFSFTVNDNPFIPMDDIYLHPDFGYIRVEGLADDVAGAIGFLNGQLRSFVPTEDEFRRAVEKIKGNEAMMMGGDKSRKLFDALRDSLFYVRNPFAGSPVTLTFQSLQEFAKEYFAPSNMIISVVSPSSPETINTLFDGLGFSPVTNEPPLYTPTLVTHAKEGTVERSVGGERSYLFWGFVRPIDPNDAPALQALSLILSERIVFDIREKQGMAYNISAGIDVITDKALFYVSQGTRPQNVAKLIPQYPRFFQISTLDSLTQADLEKSVNMYLGRMMFRRLSSINQAYYLGYSAYFFNDFTSDARFLERLRNVTLTEVKDAAKRYMQVTNPQTVIVR
jgi:predicted Zn-dependent peptidase